MIKSTLKRLFTYKFHVRPLLNPLISSEISSLGNYRGVTDNKRDVQIVVSLTSYRERFDKLPLTLYSLLNQKTKPDRIILWLDESSEDFAYLPYEITQFVKNGLEIRFVKDIKSYTKIYYALKEFADSIIVTADDDIYYPANWLEKLYLSYISHPEDIQAHRAHRIILRDGKITPYESWQKHINEESARFDNFLTGVGGVLYPPNCFSKEVLRKDIFLKEAPSADDIWLWVMALVHNHKIRVVDKHIKTLICTDILSQFLKPNLYKNNKNGGNDKQLENLMKYYGRNVLGKFI